MLWLDHLRKDAGAYHNFLTFLEDQKNIAAMHILQAKDMEAVNKIKGRVEGLTVLHLFVTEQEREEADATERAAQRERAAAGISLAH